MVISCYAGGDARGASRLLDFETGRFVRRTCRIPAADLPAGLLDCDDIQWTGTLWVLARYFGHAIERMIRLPAARRRLAPRQGRGRIPLLLSP